MPELKPKHSPLGASSAERWMKCPGSVTLIKSLGLGESDDSEYSREGTLAHEVLSNCLRQKVDAWELCSETDMALAVQEGVDVCRSLITPHGVTYIEEHITSDIHEDFAGTVDFAHVADSLLNVVDYKHGVGIPVEVDHNPQLLYYAFGILQKHPDVRRVVIRIVQPRCPHSEGSVRKFVISAEELTEWVETTLAPAMERTNFDHTLDAGPHCRFCPAKLVCPLMKSLFEAACTSDHTEVINMTDDILGRQFKLVDVVYMYLKAIKDEVSRRVLSGRKIESAKLVAKKSDRIYREGAQDVFNETFREEAFSTTLKSPAQMEKLGDTAKQMVREWAYQPQTGYTVAPVSDKRRAVELEKVEDVFRNYASDSDVEA